MAYVYMCRGSAHPGWILLLHACIYRAIFIVRARQIPSGQKKLVHDLTTCKHEGLLEELCPFILRARMISIQPAFEGSKFLPEFDYLLCVDNCRVNFQAIADDARICEQTSAIISLVASHLLNDEAIIGIVKIPGLFQDRNPREPRLIDLEHETLEKGVIVV